MKLTELLGNSSPGALTLFAIGFTITLIATLAARIFNGATPEELLRSRCYELPPLRGLIHVINLGLIGLWLTCGGALIVEVFRAFDRKPAAPHVWGAVVAAVGAAVLFFGWRVWYRRLVNLGENRPPAVDVAEVDADRGIPPLRLDRLGQERFPNELSENWRAEINLRWLLVLLSSVEIGLVVYGSFDSVKSAPWRRMALKIAGGIQHTISLPFGGLAIFVGVTAAIGLATLLWSNRTYQLVTFFRGLAIQAALVVAVLTLPATMVVEPTGFVWVFTGCVVACLMRWISDLRRCGNYRRTKSVYDAIAAQIEAAVPPLKPLTKRSDCQLEPINKRELSQRITQGCRNVEGADALVTRNFARYMSLVNVEYEHFIAAMLRMLTVRRYVSESGGSGTSRALQDPQVPAWDEALFPVTPPRGFLNWLDPLHLHAGWDRVSWCYTCAGSGQMNCTGCGGSGSVSRTETYTEYSNGQSQSRTRTVTETCSGCGGSGKVTCTTCSGLGRLEFGRTLNTHWQRLMPTTVSPDVPMAELMEDAEERVYYRQPLVEDREVIDVPAVNDGIGDDLKTLLDETVQKLVPMHGAAAEQTLKLHDAPYLYRSDFQLTGFWTLCIHFRRLRGRHGWFFGKRPEFYFPTLPLSWSMLGTLVFLPPLVLMCLPAVVQFVKACLHAFLPAA